MISTQINILTVYHKIWAIDIDFLFSYFFIRKLMLIFCLQAIVGLIYLLLKLFF